MNRALAEAAAGVVDEALPVQAQLGDLLGLPEDRPALQAVRRGGRPAGAQNKRVAEVADLVRKHLGDVLLHTAAVALMPIDQLLALGLKPGEALAEKRLAAATVLPYLEQRKPLAVDVTGRSVVFLDINIGAAPGEQDQGLIDGLVMQLDGAQLDDARNPLASLAVPAGAQLIEDQASSGPSGRAGGDQARAARATPGGGGFRPVAPSHAPATVVSPEGGIFDETRNQGSAGSGVGE